MGRNAIRSVTFRTVLTVFLLCAAAGCERETPRRVTLENGTSPPSDQTPSDSRAALRVGIGGMLTPEEGYRYYIEAIGFLERTTGLPMHIIEPGDYAQINALLKGGGMDFSFVCSGPYVTGHDEFGLELLAVPVVKGETVYHSYIIVGESCDAEDLTDLKGRTFAFTDPESNTGCLVPTFLLARMGTTPETFFSRVLFTGSHDASIDAVAAGQVDGAAVDSIVWEYDANRAPEKTSRTRIIHRSQPFGIPPVVTRPALDPSIRECLFNALTSMEEDPEGRRILAGMGIDRFVAGKDSDYDSIRAMNAWVQDRGEAP